MEVRVYPMRRRGRRLPWREIENGPSYVGALQSYRTKHGEQDYDAITLQCGSPAEGKPLQDLYEPTLVLFALTAFVLRGYERLDTPEGIVGVVQEWHCREP
jgi:hypothetical protein